MEEKKWKVLFRKLHNSTVGKVLFFSFSMIVIIGAYVGLSKHAEQAVFERNIREKAVTSDQNIMACIESVTAGNGELELTGWGTRLGATTLESCLVLKEIDETKELLLDTVSVRRVEVGSYFETDSTNAGFAAHIKEKELEENACYEILLYLKYEEEKVDEEGVINKEEYEKKISTGRYLCNGEIYPYNPLGYFQPAVDDEDVQEVVKNGEIIAHDKENGVWIYEYDATLYWIVQFELFGSLDCSPEIPLFVYRIKDGESVPEIEREYKGIYPTTEDYEVYDDADYYICSMPLVEKESIVYFNTGVYQNRGDNVGWVWNVKYVMDTNWMK